jgi:hypothetical protein
MKKIILILITNFALLLIPISANAATIALHKTEVKSHEKKHKSESNSETPLMRFFLIAGSLLIFTGWRIYYFILPNALGIALEVRLLFLGFFSGLLGIAFLLLGIILWFQKVNKEEKQRAKKRNKH